MNFTHHVFYFLLVCATFSFGMQEMQPIPTHIQDAILHASTTDEGASIFNECINNGSIPPTLVNTRWCIYTLADKVGGPDKTNTFTIAQKLVPELAQVWLADYSKSFQGFEYASLNLIEAIKCDNQTMAAFLLRTTNMRLANITMPAPMIGNVTAAFWCAQYNRPQILYFLLKAGADQKVYNSIGHAPIHTAITNGFQDVVEILLTQGIDPDYPEQQQNYTPLILLADNANNVNHLKIAQLLLDAGADRTKTDSYGYTAAQRADRFNTGGLRGQLKNYIETYKPSEKI